MRGLFKRASNFRICSLAALSGFLVMPALFVAIFSTPFSLGSLELSPLGFSKTLIFATLSSTRVLGTPLCFFGLSELMMSSVGFVRVWVFGAPFRLLLLSAITRMVFYSVRMICAPLGLFSLGMVPSTFSILAAVTSTAHTAALATGSGTFLAVFTDCLCFTIFFASNNNTLANTSLSSDWGASEHHCGESRQDNELHFETIMIFYEESQNINIKIRSSLWRFQTSQLFL
jgi:hypothetical protein